MLRDLFPFAVILISHRKIYFSKGNQSLYYPNDESNDSPTIH